MSPNLQIGDVTIAGRGADRAHDRGLRPAVPPDASAWARLTCRHRDGGLRFLRARTARCGAPRRHRRGDEDALPLMVIQLVGREAEWIAKGAKLAEQAGAESSISNGLPLQGSDRRVVRLRPDAEPELAARLIAAAVDATIAARHLEDAAGLGRKLDERARDRRARRAAGHQGRHHSRPHRAINSIKARPIGARWPPSKGGENSRHRQRRHHRF